MYNVINARKTKRGISHDTITTDGETRTSSYSAVRGGLSWPMGTMPAYHCILGEEHIYFDRDDLRDQRGKLHLLSECEYPGLSIDQMFDKLTDDCARLCCSTVYTLTEEKYTDYLGAYQNFCHEKKIKIGRLEQAPFAENFQLGASLINDWLRTGSLILPEQSIVREQLKRISKQELADKPEDKFYAINGLRFAVAAFHKFKPVRYGGAWRRNRHSAMAI